MRKWATGFQRAKGAPLTHCRCSWLATAMAVGDWDSPLLATSKAHRQSLSAVTSYICEWPLEALRPRLWCSPPHGHREGGVLKALSSSH